MSVVVFPAALLNPQPPLNIVFDYGADASGVADSSNAWGRALAASAEQRRPLQMPTGTYLIGTGPGSVVDADVHDCPEVNYDYIDIEAIGGPVTLKCVPFATAAFPSQNISNSILKAKSSTGGTFRLRGDFVIDGAITTTPTLSTGADPEAQVPLEIIGYDTVKIEYLEVKNCYGNRDNRDDPAAAGYDAGADGICQFRRGGLLIDECGTVDIRLHVGETWREGPFVTNGCVNRNIVFSYAGPSSWASGRVSSPLNAFGRVAPDGTIFGSAANDVSTTITVLSVTGAWAGSFANVGWTGSCFIDQRCVIAGAIGTSGTASGSTVSADANNWGPGWDFGSEINPDPSGPLHVSGVRMKDNFRYSVYLVRSSDDNAIEAASGDIDVDGGWLGPRIIFVSSLALTIKVRDVVRYFTGSTSAGYGDGLTVEDCGTGFINCDLAAALEAEWTWSGSDTDTRLSRFGINKERSDGVVILGRTEGFARAGYYGDASTSQVDNTGVHLFGSMSFHDGNYAVSDDGGGRFRVGHSDSLRVTSAYLQTVTLNNGPLFGSGKAVVFAISMPGVKSIIVSPGGYNLASADVGGLDFYTDDGSTPGPGLKGRVFGKTDPNGRDLQLYTAVTDHTGGDVLYERKLYDVARQAAAGYYFTSPGYSFGTGTIALVADTLYAIPFNNSLLADRLYMEITSGAVGAARLGIYQSGWYGGLDDAALIEEASGTVDTNSVALQALNLARARRFGGPLWLVAVANSAPTIRGLTVSNFLHSVLGRNQTTSTNIISHFTQAYSYGALPATFPGAGTPVVAATAPGIYVRGV